MGKSKPKAVDTSGLQQATQQATALQKEMYEKGLELSQPFYDVGVSSIGRLSDLLGLSGGSMQTRDQIYQDLLPQYTSSTTSAVPSVVNIGGRAANVDQLLDPSITDEQLFGLGFAGLRNMERDEITNRRNQLQGIYQSTGDVGAALSGAGLANITSTPTVNYEALNAAVDEALAGQELPSDYGSLTERFSLDKFEEDPSYQYRKAEGEKALERAMAAQGVTLGGGGFGSVNPQVAKALMEQSQGMASQEYGNAYNRYVQDQLNQYNMLAGLAGYGTTGLNTMVNSGSQYGTNVGNLTTGLASAQMNANLAAQAQPSMFEQLLPVAGQLGAAAIFASDRRLKRDIKKIGTKNGHKLYEFSYKGEPERYVGVMAQEVQEIMPKAVVVMPNGYLGVNYGMIGLEMRQV